MSVRIVVQREFHMILKYLIISACLFLAACGPSYDSENAIPDFKASMFCAKGSDYYSFEDECENKSASFEAFVKEQDGGDFVMSLSDPKGIKIPGGTEFLADISNSFKLEPGNKIRLKGRFTGTSFTGLAEFSAGSYEKAPRTELEASYVKAREKNDKLDIAESRITRAYYHCADKAMARLPKTECPKPSNAGGLGKVVDDEILVEGVCFFGDQTIIIECNGGKYGMSATLTKFEVN